MKVTINLTEADIKKAILDHIENNTRFTENVGEAEITITFAGDAQANAPFMELVDEKATGASTLTAEHVDVHERGE